MSVVVVVVQKVRSFQLPLQISQVVTKVILTKVIKFRPNKRNLAKCVVLGIFCRSMILIFVGVCCVKLILKLSVLGVVCAFKLYICFNLEGVA